jgi:hypothetical protein
MRDKNGVMVAAVLGGELSKGMEVWNPKNQSVKIITTAIPPETSAGTKKNWISVL